MLYCIQMQGKLRFWVLFLGVFLVQLLSIAYGDSLQSQRSLQALLQFTKVYRYVYALLVCCTFKLIYFISDQAGLELASYLPPYGYWNLPPCPVCVEFLTVFFSLISSSCSPNLSLFLLFHYSSLSFTLSVSHTHPLLFILSFKRVEKTFRNMIRWY